jgi:putative endonuclease
MFYTYIIECADGTMYTGWTTQLDKRIESHNSGKGAKYTRGRHPVRLLAAWSFSTRNEAMACESKIKRLTREAKQDLCSGSLSCPQVHAIPRMMQH